MSRNPVEAWGVTPLGDAPETIVEGTLRVIEVWFSHIAAALPFPDRQSTSFQIPRAHLRSERGPTPT